MLLNLYIMLFGFTSKKTKAPAKRILVVQEQYGFLTQKYLEEPRYSPILPSWWNTYIKDPDGKRGMIDISGNEFLIHVGRGWI